MSYDLTKILKTMDIVSINEIYTSLYVTKRLQIDALNQGTNEIVFPLFMLVLHTVTQTLSSTNRYSFVEKLIFSEDLDIYFFKTLKHHTGRNGFEWLIQCFNYLFFAFGIFVHEKNLRFFFLFVEDIVKRCNSASLSIIFKTLRDIDAITYVLRTIEGIKTKDIQERKNVIGLLQNFFMNMLDHCDREKFTDYLLEEIQTTTYGLRTTNHFEKIIFEFLISSVESIPLMLITINHCDTSKLLSFFASNSRIKHTLFLHIILALCEKNHAQDKFDIAASLVIALHKKCNSLFVKAFCESIMFEEPKYALWFFENIFNEYKDDEITRTLCDFFNFFFLNLKNQFCIDVFTKKMMSNKNHESIVKNYLSTIDDVGLIRSVTSFGFLQEIVNRQTSYMGIFRHAPLRRYTDLLIKEAIAENKPPSQKLSVVKH